MNATNTAYVCMFMRNSGEELRAVIIAKDIFGCSLMAARDWVRALKRVPKMVSREAARKVHAEYPTHLNEEELEDFCEWTFEPERPTEPEPQKARPEQWATYTKKL